jgi:hypothetical protein
MAVFHRFPFDPTESGSAYVDPRAA